MEPVNGVRVLRLSAGGETVDVLCVHCRAPRVEAWLHAADVVLAPPRSWGAPEYILECLPGCLVVVAEGLVLTRTGIHLPSIPTCADAWTRGVLAYAALLNHGVWGGHTVARVRSSRGPIREI